VGDMQRGSIPAIKTWAELCIRLGPNRAITDALAAWKECERVMDTLAAQGTETMEDLRKVKILSAI